MPPLVLGNGMVSPKGNLKFVFVHPHVLSIFEIEVLWRMLPAEGLVQLGAHQQTIQHWRYCKIVIKLEEYANLNGTLLNIMARVPMTGPLHRSWSTSWLHTQHLVLWSLYAALASNSWA